MSPRARKNDPGGSSSGSEEDQAPGPDLVRWARKYGRNLPRPQELRVNLSIYEHDRRHRLHLAKIAEQANFDLTKYEKEAA